MSDPAPERVSLATIARQWGRIGCIGFGGPPAHLKLLHRMCVEEQKWITAEEFQDGVAATGLLPGPASTQMAIYCAWRLRGVSGALVGGAGFILPGLVVILGLARLFLEAHPPRLLAGAAGGAAAAVPAVALAAAWALGPASYTRAGERTAQHIRWGVELAAGAAAAITIGRLLVAVLLACGLVEVAVRHRPEASDGSPEAKPRRYGAGWLLGAALPVVGGIGALVWVAVEVGALSYGGGFVIVPLMQHDAVNTYHWMTASQFLDAVALGQVTPGPVVQTVAVVGDAAAGIAGGLLASLVAFTPSFFFILVGAPHFERLRRSDTARAFLNGAGPAAIGAIAGSSVSLGLALSHLWQVGLLILAVGLLARWRSATVYVIVGAALVGMAAAALAAPVTR